METKTHMVWPTIPVGAWPYCHETTDTDPGNLAFGLGIGCSAGWYGYTGGLPGYNTAGYYFPAGNITIIAWVTLQAEKPFPGVANSIFRDIARIVTPANVPFVMGTPTQNK